MDQSVTFRKRVYKFWRDDFGRLGEELQQFSWATWFCQLGPKIISNFLKYIVRAGFWHSSLNDKVLQSSGRFL